MPAITIPDPSRPPPMMVVINPLFLIQPINDVRASYTRALAVSETIDITDIVAIPAKHNMVNAK